MAARKATKKKTTKKATKKKAAKKPAKKGGKCNVCGKPVGAKACTYKGKSVCCGACLEIAKAGGACPFC